MKSYLYYSVFDECPNRDTDGFWKFWLSFGEEFWIDDYMKANSIKHKVYGSAAVCRAAKNLKPGQYLSVAHYTVY